VSEKLKASDVVHLVTGGPRMTVEKVDEDNIVRCVWFDRLGDKLWGDPKRATFATALLVKESA
jgi:uncharacterized protein YodC (DUF2158 family)